MIGRTCFPATGGRRIWLADRLHAHAPATSDVGGELVTVEGMVVDVINSTSNNPFTLTAPSEGVYTVNAGYKDPNRDWGSTSIVVSSTGIGNTTEPLLPQAITGLKP